LVNGSSPNSGLPALVRPALVAALTSAAVITATPAHAYVGPGAGIALFGSFFIVFATILLAGVILLVLPFRLLFRWFRFRSNPKPLVPRVIVVGFDGQDTRVTERLMAEGRMPNFSRLADMGCYRRLTTTYPSITPVAWSSFSTGANPGKHNIFDFLDRDPRTYLPRLSSAYIGSIERFLKLGKFRIPLAKPEIRLLRKSKPFWKILGENNIWSTILRVPITFPPEKFYGAQLGAMCIPDLLGTQGTFMLFTTRSASEGFQEGGIRCDLDPGGSGTFSGAINGPENVLIDGNPPLTIPFTLTLNGENRTARLECRGSDPMDLELGVLSGWLKLEFPVVPGMKATGNTRVMLTEMGDVVSLYMAPINIEPGKPAMPISHPGYYSTYLEKKIGPYATLGLAEDTWALNEKVTDDRAFWEQTQDVEDERERMFFAALDRLRKGCLVTVFDATDRIQHMYWRYTEDGHPAAEGLNPGEYADAIDKHYQRNDAMLGRILARLRDDDLLFVLSDHGFTSFRRGVNLNAWLLREGYLHLKEGADGAGNWLQDVDWSRTRAYAVGLVGLFLNIEGRENHGIVAKGDEAAALKAEIIAKLSGLRDEEKSEIGINEVFDADALYSGPYKGNAPDLLVGYNHGYRISWDCASGKVAGPVFDDNVKAWSGDHIVDPRLVPGILLSNRTIDRDDPHIVDMAPTILSAFGLRKAPHMEGSPLIPPERLRPGAAHS
jgi:predicted AlkP superfamily phosphohydrolase/phosphomutase